MRNTIPGAVAGFALLLASCGGGGSGGSSGSASSGSGNAGTTPPVSTPTPTPTPVATCSLRSRQDWAAAQLREHYLFPETLPATLDPAGFTSVEDYIDALTATARAQGRDRFFTYLTSIAEEEAFFDRGETAAFGIRLMIDSAARRVFVADAYEGAPALAAGLDRGTEILAIGTSDATLRTVDAIFAAEGSAGISNAFGPATPGTQRTFRVTDALGTRTPTIVKTDFEIPPISTRFGTQILDNGGTRVGYINLRTFISTANPALRSAFAQFRSQGITNVIVDFRYNGGGLLSTSELMGDLMGDNRQPNDVFAFTTFRPEKSSSNTTRNFRRQPESIATMRVAFIATEATASASEIVINAFTPYLGAATGLIGTDTFGKPVGQIARDRAECDDRLRITAFAVSNASRQGDYYNGLAATVGTSCRADDSLAQQMGNPTEASTRTALDFLAGRACAPIGSVPDTLSTSRSANPQSEPTMAMLMPDRPTTAQRELPGTF